MIVRRVTCATLLAMLAVVLLTLGGKAGGDIKPDEEVVFFPTYAYLDTDGENWVIPTHGWIYEPEKDSVSRRALMALLGGKLGLDAKDAELEIFKERARLFLVDNERGKQITIHFGTRAYPLNASLSNGHFRTSVYVPVGELKALAARQKVREDWLQFRAVTRPGDKRVFVGAVQFLAPTGVSVISDIDDTIKVSNVSDREALVRNTFLKEFEAVPGMAELYQQWAKKGVRFHYVSSSPWQLYEPLRTFMVRSGFPLGSFRLKTFRWKDRSFFSLFASPEVTKPEDIHTILCRYPERKFILEGDSGEKEPEIYAAIARESPGQIVGICIRNVTGEAADGERYQKCFRDIPRDRWMVFDKPEEVAERSLRLLK